MNIKRLAAVSLSTRDFVNFDEKLEEAAQWMKHAAGLGADLVVFPEEINKYRGDGPGNPRALSLSEAALDSLAPVARLIELADSLHVAVAIPLLMRHGAGYINEFSVFSNTGQLLGKYQKICPTPEELKAGVIRGTFTQPLIAWDGVKIGGALCFDSQFEEVFASQAERGADLILMPSLWPGGRQLNWYAMRHGIRIALSYPAWSRIVDIDGCEAAEGGYRHETLRFGRGAPVIVADINFDRRAFFDSSTWVDIESKYGKQVRVKFDQANVLVYLESLSPDFTVDDLAREFGMTGYTDYVRACRALYPDLASVARV